MHEAQHGNPKLQPTGLVPRELLHENVAALLRDPIDGVGHAIALTELEGLKAIQKVHGPDAASAVFAATRELISQHLRGDDFGGAYSGEVCLLCFPHTPVGAAFKTLECLRTTIELHRFVHDEHLFRLTMSIGLASAPSDGTTMDEVCKAAEDALYEAKRRGHNVVALSAGAGA